MKSAAYLLSAVLAAGIPFAWAQGPAPTDPQIAAIVVAANQADIDAGKLAERRAHSRAVRTFARRMVTDHTDVNRSAIALVHELHVTPQSNPTSLSLTQGGDRNLAQLEKLHGAAFDKAYIDHEVAYHESVIDAVDKVLIPSARNSKLKALLVKVRPLFADHLEHARRIQASLGGA
jgi:putative membrane protein